MSDEPAWRPTASLDNLRLRAQVLEGIRGFFKQRGVLEVETPVLCASTTPDPNIDSVRSRVTVNGAVRPMYLHTSPEFAMKRLLAAGSGSIYQICKVFCDGEAGRLHNPEFTMLEWYRCGWDHHALMDEVEALLTAIINKGPAQRHSYHDVFRRFTGVDLSEATDEVLHRRAMEFGLSAAAAHTAEGRDLYLNFLMSHVVTPHLGHDAPVFVYDFPTTQAAMARIRAGTPPVAERFELFVNGVELANGYHELNDVDEQRYRFEQERRRRRLTGKPAVGADKRLISALAHGLPDCAGVALGLDRLVMLCAGVEHIEDVLSFPMQQA